MWGVGRRSIGGIVKLSFTTRRGIGLMSLVVLVFGLCGSLSAADAPPGAAGSTPPAAPTPPPGNQPPADPDDALLEMVRQKYNLPGQRKKEPVVGGDGSDGNNGEDERAGAAGGESSGETPEQVAEREAAEAAAAEEAAAAAGGETPEQKAEREAAIAAAVTEATKGKDTELAKVTQEKVDLERQLAAATSNISLEVHPLLLADNPKALESWEKKANEFETWALQNWDGVDADEENGVQGWSKEQIRGRYAELRQVKETILPQARTLMTQRKQYDVVARQEYPQLFDAKAPEYQVAQGFLQVCPAAKQFPDVMLLIGDAMVGEKIRLEKAKAAKAKAAGSAAPKVAPKVAPKAAPRVPLAGGVRPAPKAAGTPNTGPKDFDVKAFVGKGATRSALVDMLVGAGINQ